MATIDDAYRERLDAEMLAYIDQVEAAATGGTPNVTESRAAYARMNALFHAGYPDGVLARDETIIADPHPVPTRHYRLAETDSPAVVVYLHGGGFVVGDLETHDSICADLCHQTGCEVIAVDYRLSPENAHPAALDDGKAVFTQVAVQTERPIILCGDSAGANLAAAICHWARDRDRRPAGQVLIYPELGGDSTRGSYVTHAQAPQLTRDDILHYRGIRNGDGSIDTSRDPSAFPLLDSDFSNLPPTAIFCADCDPLCDDGPEYAARIQAGGGQAQCTVEQGLVHGYLRARHMSQRAGDSFNRICQAVKEFAGS